MTLGPSGIEPVVRAAIFHGYEPRDDGAGRLATEVHLETFAALHEVAGQPPPRGLLGLLARFAPFPFPMGFEAPAAAPPSLKAYLVVERMAPERKRAALAALLAHAGAAPPPLLAEVPEADLDMIGLGTADGRLATVKLYVRRDPTRPFARASLPALAPSHPAVALAEGRAYATIDLVQPRPRPPKWDLPLRDRLLAGPQLPAAFAPALPEPALASLTALVDHRDFRVDAAAVALRDAHTTLYLCLG